MPWTSPSCIFRRKNHITSETRTDINSSFVGFVSLCKLFLTGQNSINPGYLNSDIVENLFGQQRGLRNGMNTNPTVAQYGPANTAIILGQCTVSNKSNKLFHSNNTMPTKHHQKQVSKIKEKGDSYMKLSCKQGIILTCT